MKLKTPFDARPEPRDTDKCWALFCASRHCLCETHDAENKKHDCVGKQVFEKPYPKFNGTLEG